ncbi:hypothetical protein ACFC09_44720 [Streptomyces sp. NPDC056161]|uniref:hypothetical protein n=1 Tax=Streptomyces sp. NPDC056161 TaxID=3345732 RepID=UPI0035DAF8D9
MTSNLVTAGPGLARPSPTREDARRNIMVAGWQRDRDQHSIQLGELIHHSDAGSQYTGFKLAGHLGTADVAASIGSVGDVLDNVLMESRIGLCKTE